jgi:hypothetical protein
LQIGNPQVVLKTLVAYTKLDGFDSTSTLLEWIPPTVSSEILRSIGLIHFITRYQNLYQEVSSARAYALGATKLVDEDGYYKFCTSFLTTPLIESTWSKLHPCSIELQISIEVRTTYREF